MPNGGLGTGTSEDGGNVGNASNLRFLVAPLFQNQGLPHGRFGGENSIESFVYAQLVQPLPKHMGKRTLASSGNIGYADRGRIHLGSASHGTDQSGPVFQAMLDKGYLRAESIYCIHNAVHIIQREEQRKILLTQEFIDTDDLQVWIDVKQTFTKHIHLPTPYRGMQGQNLTVYVAFAYVVRINQHKVTYSRTSEHFRGVSSHPSDSHYGDTRRTQFLHIAGSKQQSGAGLPYLSIGIDI